MILIVAGIVALTMIGCDDEDGSFHALLLMALAITAQLLLN